VIARGLRSLGVALVCVFGLTAAASLFVGLLADVSALRALSGGYLLVGSLLFTAGALVGLRDPARARERERRTTRRVSPGGLATWSEAFQLSALLVGLGIGLVLVGIALSPRASFT
jgi:hypothetical protein